MALKSYKPTTPGQRGLVLIDRSELWKGRPVKTLTEGLTKTGGRNNTGRVTMWHKGGGAKRLYRVVDFRRTKFDVPATVERIEYDPNRTAFIALIRYEDSEQAYILAPQRLAVGDKVVASRKADIKPGYGALLDKVADEREIGVEQTDLTEHIFRRAQQSGSSPEQEMQHMMEHNHLPEWMTEIRRGKALQQIVEAATVTDSEGNTIDLKALAEEPVEDEPVEVEESVDADSDKE